ncbi:ABC transporter substrate-binding protein [Fusibacter sp. 3D3]|uniref:ABC transporter substrate-binding protein n=1 Tax=Fusibacter sp. 3D3 TaxID=1048380 RepID=UPI0008537145|nr:ABC transporter substrate-binding protein [Fusibacter sp. 3D3]GAU76574.1 oligopeptide ABC transporter periplasmic oligopeptide-binding protein OppA [Fusibacter sp. 3D3]
MKKWMISLLILTMSFIFVACGSAPQDVNESGKAAESVESADLTTSSSSEAESGLKTLNMAIFWLDPNLEPTEGWNGWALTRCGIGENLVQIDENLKFKSVLAASYEQIDEKTTVFRIREDAKFQNGKPVDAAACKASIERALEISDRDDVKFGVDVIEAEGQTLTIKTLAPETSLINKLTDPVFIIVDTEAAKDENFKYAPICTGAFKVVNFDPALGMTLEKNANHWSGDIAVDVVNVKYIQDGTIRTMALQSGEIDLATQIQSKDLGIFENDENYVVYKGPNLRVFILRLNMDKPYMRNKAFRQALSYGMDKATYATQIVSGIPAKGPFNDSLPFGYEGDDYYTYNPEQAMALLDAEGFLDTDGDGIRESEGKNIVLKYVSRTNHGIDANNIGIAMQSQYKAIGLGLEVIQVENYADMAKSGDFDMLWERWTSAPSADPEYFLTASYKSGSAGNYGKYTSDAFDTLCDTLEKTDARSERESLGIKGSEMLIEDVASLFLYYQEGNVVTRKNVGGVYRFISEIYYIDDRITVK